MSASNVTSASNNIWGVFDANNNPAFVVDTYMMLSPSASSKVSEFPVENGSFASFNKVQKPREVSIRVSLGGDPTAMTTLLEKFETLRLSTAMLSVVTPYAVYLNMVLTNYKNEHTSIKGASRIEADLKFEEIRQVTPTFSNVALPASKVKNPASASSTDGGKQQGQTPPTSILSSGVNSVTSWFKK